MGSAWKRPGARPRQTTHAGVNEAEETQSRGREAARCCACKQPRHVHCFTMTRFPRKASASFCLEMLARRLKDDQRLRPAESTLSRPKLSPSSCRRHPRTGRGPALRKTQMSDSVSSPELRADRARTKRRRGIHHDDDVLHVQKSWRCTLYTCAKNNRKEGPCCNIICTKGRSA